MTRSSAGQGLWRPLLLAFACVFANGLATIAGDALFVSLFSLGELSVMLGAAAIVRVLSALGYASLVQRAAHRGVEASARLDAGLVALAGITLALSAPLASGAGRPLALLLVFASLVLPPLLPLIAFNAVTSLLAAREAKRVLPLVAAAATVGSVAAGAVAAAGSLNLGLGLSFAGAALASSVAAPLVLALGKAQPTEAIVKQPEESFWSHLSATAADVRRVAAVRIVVVFATLSALIGALADYAFKAALKQSYGQAEMAAALGLFAIAANVVVLLLQVLVLGRVAARFGVGRVLIAGPLSMAAFAGGALALAPLIGSGMVRLGELILRYGLGNSIADVLLVPLGRAVRTRAKIVVKGSASPLGGVLAAALLLPFGDAGPTYQVQILLLLGSALLLAWQMLRAPRAYAEALTIALKRGTAEDVGPEASTLFRSELVRLLEEAVIRGDLVAARRTMELMTDRLFAPIHVRAALGADNPELRRFAIVTAARLTGPGEGAELFALVPFDPDPETELAVLQAARQFGALATEQRTLVPTAAAPTTESDSATARCWAEAQLHRALAAQGMRQTGDRSAQAKLDLHLKALRKVAKDTEGGTRAAALLAIGELGDRRAEREVQSALATKDPRVFAAAARTAVVLDLPGVVSGLVARLMAGPHAGASARALALAGPRAVRELVMALPVSMGEGAVAPTAVAEGLSVSGTARAARALARLGPQAASEVLSMYGSLGHRARIAVAHAFGSERSETRIVESAAAHRAIGVLLDYGHALLGYLPRYRSHLLLGKELERRLVDIRHAILDLLGAVEPRPVVERARHALTRGGQSRDNALELIETLLPSADAARYAALFAPPGASVSGPPLEGWLDKCRKFDEGEIPSTDPMLTVLERVLLLQRVPLFERLSGEELYPVAEICMARQAEPGESIVLQGEPSDDLYVVWEGRLDVQQDNIKIGELSAGQAFGELGVLDGAPRSATVVAAQQTRMLRIPRIELEALLDESPELAKGIIATLLGYVRANSEARAQSAAAEKGAPQGAPVPAATAEG